MKERLQLFGSFTKVEEQSDGSLYVEGIASSEVKDKQGETVKASAMAAALPEYLKFPTIREMHEPWAAGKTTAITVSDDGKTYIGTKIVDAEAIKKVRAGVYGGFSIGGSVPVGGRNKDNPKVIEQIDLIEISLVDRPANPDAVITLYKREEPVVAEKPTEAADAKPAEQPKPDATAKAAEAAAAPLAAAEAKPADEPAAVAKAEDKPADTIAKGRYPAPAKAALKSIHDQLRCVEKAMCELKYEADDEGSPDVEMAAKTGELQKRAEDLAKKVDELEKRTTEAEAATKLAGEALKKVVDERDALKKQLAEANAKLATKGALKVVAVGKEEDVDPAQKRLAEDPNASPLDLVKTIHAGGGRRIA